VQSLAASLHSPTVLGRCQLRLKFDPLVTPLGTLPRARFGLAPRMRSSARPLLQGAFGCTSNRHFMFHAVRRFQKAGRPSMGSLRSLPARPRLR
jgi:hypothetical protein